MKLYGKDITRASLAAHSGGARSLAGTRLVEYADGGERGVRVVQCRTGGGLEFCVLIDRCCDIGEASLHGLPFSWAGATGARHPGLQHTEAEDGLGFLRGFSGLLTTCGLDHVFGPAEVDGSGFCYPRRVITKQPLHGRIWNEPARLVAHGTRWTGEDGEIYVTAEVTQAAVFGEHLVLRRTIRAPIGGTHLVIEDEVENLGFAATAHMLLYHIDLGFPLLDDGARIIAPVEAVEWASHAASPGLDAQDTGWNEVSAPRWPFVEQVWQHRLKLDAQGFQRAMLVNGAANGGDGLGVAVKAKAAELPRFLTWQAYASGIYALGLEFCTNAADGRAGAEAHRELIRLQPGETRRYAVEIAALTGGALDATRAEIEALGKGPAGRFPPPGGIPQR